MKILLTNDDGFEAPGIVQLYESLKDKYEVFFLAPKENMSGKGSAITVWDQPSFQNHGNGIHSLNGTPVDCVKYAINFYCPFTPDLVVSGINPGPNLGTDILFSGTVGAALEGRNLKYPSIALSANSFELNDYSHQVKISEEIIGKVDQLEFNSQCILNVNIPNLPFNEIEGFTFTRLGNRGVPLAPEFDGDDKTVSYKIGKSGDPDGDLTGTDFEAIANKNISVTPLFWDMTNLEKVKGKLPNV